MSSGELVHKSLFLFGDGQPGAAMLWIRDGGAGAEGVPCLVDRLHDVLEGVPYRVAAPGVECALRLECQSVEVALERPGGNRVSWSIPDTTFRAALSHIARA